MDSQVDAFFQQPDLPVGIAGEEEEEPVSLYKGHNGRADYTKCHALPKSTDKSLLPFLDTLTFDEEAKMEAEKIYQNMSPAAKKGKRLRKIAFYCVFKGFISLGRPKDPKVVAELVKIPFTDVNKSFSMCSEGTPALPTAVFHSPMSFLPQYAQMVGLDSSCFQDLQEFGQKILDKDPDLNDNYPQVVAAGILRYYMDIQGATYPKGDFAKLVKRSEMTISKMVKQIEATHNT